MKYGLILFEKKKKKKKKKNRKIKMLAAAVVIDTYRITLNYFASIKFMGFFTKFTVLKA